MVSWERNLDPVQRDFIRHPVRRRIVDLLAARPGLNKSQIARELNIHLNLARFHLRRLEAVEIVVMQPSPRMGEVVCFLASDAHLWDDEMTRVLFGSSPVARVARGVVHDPGATAQAIADVTGLSPGAVHHHLRTLLRRGLVTRYRHGAAYRHYPEDPLLRWADATEQ